MIDFDEDIEDTTSSDGDNTVKFKKLQRVSPTPIAGLPDRPISITDARGAKRVLGRLIKRFQEGTVDSTFAKTLCYLLMSYVNINNSETLESRIKQLEERGKV
jgi:hypothetical protein